MTPSAGRSSSPQADAETQVLDPRTVFVLAGPDARYECTDEESLAADAARREE